MVRMNNNKGIITFYNGIKFRSRLEAKWACLFDLLKWEWEYEPFDLNGWIPDFIVYGRREEILIEIKPIRIFDKTIANKMEIATTNMRESELLILGTSFIHGDFDQCAFGWLGEFIGKYTEKWEWSWGAANIIRWQGTESEEKNPNRIIGFCHEYQGFHDRITGCYDGGVSCDETAAREANNLWHKATNTVQWNAKHSN